MHKLALVILISCFLWNCSEPSPDNGVERTIELANGLSTMNIWLPQRFDTSFTWLDASDHSCGDKTKTRWADSRYSIEKENGEFYFSKFDSLYQFTVSQNTNPDCRVPADVNAEWQKARREHHTAVDVKIVLNIDTITEINGKDFIVFGFQQRFSDSLVSATLEALTLVNKQVIHLNFNCCAKDCRNFVDSMYQSLKTVTFAPH